MKTFVVRPQRAKLLGARRVRRACDIEALHEHRDVRRLPARAFHIGVDGARDTAEALLLSICGSISADFAAHELSLREDVHPRREALRDEVALDVAQMCQRAG